MTVGSVENSNQENINTGLNQMVRADKLRLLYEQSFPATFVSLFSAGLLVVALWSVQEASILITWFLSLTVSAVVRIILFVRYRQVAPAGDALLVWERPYFVSLILSSSVWGFGALSILPVDSGVHQVLVYAFLVGMSGGAISVYSANRMMVLATIAVVLFPVSIWFLLQWNLLGIVIGLGTFVYYVSAVRAGKVLSIALHKSFKLTHKLDMARAAAERMARTDELTGLSNRRTFYDRGQLSFDLCQRNDKKLAMIILDIDNFKNINDTFGHAAGDEILREVGSVLRNTIRKTDICSRIGGEEFGILLQVESLDEGIDVAEKLRQCIDAIEILFEGNSITITGSFGVAIEGENLEILFKHADDVLYKAKRAGRDQVASYSLNKGDSIPNA